MDSLKLPHMMFSRNSKEILQQMAYHEKQIQQLDTEINALAEQLDKLKAARARHNTLLAGQRAKLDQLQMTYYGQFKN